ncbi:efflux RND transporter permease subunit [Pacificimonas flava]|uniref:RND multidrug efflux transporter n=1 Tax=Pacificimonas flava TaxID=1234595 RepID=M2S8J4_9SPHN|nr:efflux RND transporter permease subunit [Pacificimonas flava]EMD81705.1 RND multidrug efflux transporter [Pacificimonas flava]MBB5281709.1 hydrophobe/amphiphile efflux-1 (HAE1) family protein [Pacificimonas flava]
MAERGDLPLLAVRRPLLVGVFNLLIVIAGLAALFGVEIRELPDVDRPIVSVTATLPGGAPETMDAEVTSVLENAVARVSGVRDIRSSSEENSSRVRIEFDPGANLETAASDVREAVSRVTRDLPDRIEQVTVVKADEDADPIMTLAVRSRAYGTAELTQIVENDVIPELLTAGGVASIEEFGSRVQQLRVAVNPIRLNRYGVTVSDVAAALENAPFDVPAGSFQSGAQSLIVRAEATAATPELIKQIAITNDTQIGDVAEAYFAPADAETFVRLNGEPIIGLGVIRQAGSNTIEISTAIRDAVARVNERFDDLQIDIISDEAEFIQISVEEVLLTLGITIAVVIGTILIFFRNLKATAIPALSIPVALIGTIAGIWLLGFSLNLLTLLGLVLATGLVVDDSIVVLENIQRLRGQGLGRRAAAVLGTRQVFFAVVATTAVLASVFVPISFLPSEVGRLFREFGFVLALAIVISAFVALSMVPAIAARMDLGGRSQGAGREGSRPDGKVLRAYGSGLERCLDHPLKTGVVSAALALAALLLYSQLDNELVPDEDRGTIEVNASGPDGVGLEFMDAELDEIERVLRPLIEEGVIESTFSIVGRYDPNRVQVTATLAPWDARDQSQSDIVASLSEPLSDIPGSRVDARGRGTLSIGGGGGGDTLEVALTGNEYEEIYASARALSDIIDAESVILSNPELSYQPTQPQLSVMIDRRRAADLGIDYDELALTLRAMVDGEEVVDLNVGDQALPVLLTSETTSVQNPSDLRNLYVRTGSGQLVPLSSVTTITEQGIAAELNRTEQRRAIEIEAAVRGDTPLQEAVAEIRRLADRTVAENIGLVLQGEAETLQETSNELLMTYGFAFVIVFLVLVAQFESLTSGLVVILSVPFALAAAVFTLFLTGVSLNIYSQIGLVMLIGLMAKNGILLVEFADQLRDEGKSVRQAVEEAAVLRLRPISMTLIATIVGAVPLVLASGAGAEARQAIGWVVFGGLGLSSLFTLFVTPVIYLAIAPFSKPRTDDLSTIESELDEAERADHAQLAATS